jgi:hypothetical protein
MKVVNVATNDALMEMKDQIKISNDKNDAIAETMKSEIGEVKHAMAQILAKLNENSK